MRSRTIAPAAYFRAEKSGLRGGDALRDWCEPEAEIDAQLAIPSNLKANDPLPVQRPHLHCIHVPIGRGSGM